MGDILLPKTGGHCEVEVRCLGLETVVVIIDWIMKALRVLMAKMLAGSVFCF